MQKEEWASVFNEKNTEVDIPFDVQKICQQKKV